MGDQQIVKEGLKFYKKEEVDIEEKIKYQQDVIASLQAQLERAQTTLSELQGAK